MLSLIVGACRASTSTPGFVNFHPRDRVRIAIASDHILPAAPEISLYWFGLDEGALPAFQRVRALLERREELTAFAKIGGSVVRAEVLQPDSQWWTAWIVAEFAPGSISVARINRGRTNQALAILRRPSMGNCVVQVVSGAGVPVVSAKVNLGVEPTRIDQARVVFSRITDEFGLAVFEDVPFGTGVIGARMNRNPLQQISVFRDSYFPTGSIPQRVVFSSEHPTVVLTLVCTECD